MYNLDKVFDICECGDNALDMVYALKMVMFAAIIHSYLLVCRLLMLMMIKVLLLWT